MRPEIGRDAAPSAARSGRGRRRPFDGRTRGAKRHRALIDHYAALTGGKHGDLVRSLVALIMQREAMEVRIAAGEMLDALDLVRVTNGITRLTITLGLTPADDEPAPDMTAEAIAALREQREVA